ncbi:hypothetical protein ANN_20835 [Periplaneta americana]|uniref:Uncharacterized protein n=1 Tax=Periplaneta americana TaxID=6978 RepID=A0ABQ8SDN7_PERAM|nr:hypothetical protein ANN_20835 [Periplaneta americana]
MKSNSKVYSRSHNTKQHFDNTKYIDTSSRLSGEFTVFYHQLNKTMTLQLRTEELTKKLQNYFAPDVHVDVQGRLSSAEFVQFISVYYELLTGLLILYVPQLSATLVKLKDRITDAFTTIINNMLLRIWDELQYRIDVCRVTRGSHIEQYEGEGLPENTMSCSLALHLAVMDRVVTSPTFVLQDLLESWCNSFDLHLRLSTQRPENIRVLVEIN